MKEVTCRIVENKPLTESVMKITLSGDFGAVPAPGQFVNIAVPGFYLRRPVSVCDFEDSLLTLIYRVSGEGTKALSKLKDGEISLLAFLGNGYDLEKIPFSPVVLGGGVGAPPMYYLTKELVRLKKDPKVIIGFNSVKDAFYYREFLSLTDKVSLVTADGSAGEKGFVTDVMESKAYALACGPEPMLKAVYNKCSGGQFSFEERMACGFGACVGCAKKTAGGMKRVCRDGPVFSKEEILWED